ncbi:MAG: amino acid adenylation domain-containing protein [Burkholderiales bacterium]
MSEKQKHYALTHPQQRIWFTEKLHPGTGMWNNAGTLKIKGKLDYALLERAVNIFLRDNESARLRVGVEDGVPYQYVADYEYYKIDCLDFTDRGVKNLYIWDRLQTQAPMPLIDSNLYYFAMIKLGENEGWLYVKFHHIISDGLAIIDFGNQVMENYQSLLSGKECPEFKLRSYIEYISEEQDYLKSKRFEYDQQYWLKRFKELPEPTVIKQKKTNYFSTKAERKAYVIPTKLSSQIRSFCSEAGISPFSLFLSVLAVHINRITGKKDIIIGAPVANRTSLHAKGAFGMFVSTVPIRIEIMDELPFIEFAQLVSNQWFSVLKHQKYPYNLLMQELRKQHKGLESLYDVTLSYQIGKFQKNTEQFTYEGRWHFSGYLTNSLSIHVNDRENNGRFIVDYDHQTPFFSEKEIEYFHSHMINILTDVIEHKNKPLFMIELMSSEERERILERFNDTDTAFPQGETLVDLWYKRLACTPKEAVAIVCGGKPMTYGELEKRSTALAAYLKKHGVTADSVVGLYVNRTADYCVSLLAILKAGGAFLPLDAELPHDRIAYMLTDSGVKVALVSPELEPRCQGFNLLTIKTDEPLKPCKERPIPDCTPSNLAYVIYTSGSTGQPKGVQIEHRSIVHFVYSMDKIWEFAPGAKLLCAASISFDISVMEVVLAFMNGATLVLAQEHEVNIPKNMARLIKAEGVNMMVVTPGRMELLLSDKQGAECLRDFREIGLGGDVLTEKLLERVQECTRARITNFYGPTEITVCATCTNVTKARVPSIGKPMPNVKTYILDEHRNPVPIGVPGELYIGGFGLSRGYINKPELTAERFIDSPFIPGQKLYRTGDLARWYPLGEIEFLGRIDKQVKIRGYRIELGEIENLLMQVPGVTACAVTDRTDASGRKFLCAYLCGNPPKLSEVRAELMRNLPAYMIPSYFVKIDSLPFNSSGKVDRDSLPDPGVDIIALKEDYAAPESATEQILADIWSDVLKTGPIGREDSFFDIGGDSLTIVSVMVKVKQKFHVDVSLEEVYRCPRLADLAALIDAAEQTSYLPLKPAPKAADYPVSSAQQRMWVLMQGMPDSKAYNIPVAFSLRGKLNKAKLGRAFKALIDRHDALRTSFVLKDSELRQIINSSVPFELADIKCAKEELGRTLKGLIQPFDLERAPLMRAAVIETGDDEHVLFIDMHHIISDARTMDILLKDLADIYKGKTPKRNEFEYKDYAVWQQEFMESKSMAVQRDYWQGALSGELPLLNLHTDRQRPAVQRFEGARLAFNISADITDKLRTFAKQRGATLFMAALAVYNVLLSKYTGQEDIIVGTPVSGRKREEIEDVAGVFINTVPLRSFPRGELSFSEFFDEVCQNTVAAFTHSEYPLERIISDLALPRDMSRNPLFDTMIAYTKDVFGLSLEGLECAYYPFDPGIAKLDLTLELYEQDGGLSCQLEYNTRLFRKSTIKRIVRHLSRLFEILVNEPNIRLCDVSVLSQEELWQVTQGFNRTDAPLDANKTIQSIFEDLAISQGDKTALIVGDEKMTFSELNKRANRIALKLRESGVGRNTIVGLCIRRSFDLMAGILGVLKAGGGFLPLDPTYPLKRLGFMLSDSGAKVLLTDGSADFHSPGVEIDLREIKDIGPCDNLPTIDKPEDAAYVIYTSGSTGTPKGTVLLRSGLINLYEGTKTSVAYDPDHVSVSITTISFDIFIMDAVLPLMIGCTVAICTEEELRQPHLLAARIESVGDSFLQTTPTRMRILMGDASFRSAAAKYVKKIILGGEEFTLSLLNMLKKYTKAKIISVYGPAETTVFCTSKDLSNTSHITIGKPIINTRMYILDKYLRPVPIGVLGEVFISGACVANGYINREELNRKKYLPDPFWPGHVMYATGDICAFMPNGEMEIRGRVDFQVKIRGMRIELGEIEAAIRTVKGVKEAVVKDWGEGANRYLCAYYAMSRNVEPETIREYLASRLPAYMVPSFFIGMKELPTTPNGKVNRKELLEPDRESAAKKRVSTSGMSETERKMAKAWARVLKTGNIGPEDNFFALGGDSLGVIKVQAHILQYGWTVRTKDFYECETLRDLCGRINQQNAKPASKALKEKTENVYIPEYAHIKKARLKNVLLTGVTGYLGAHILEQLCSEKETHIYCLVRGKDKKACERYLKEVLAFYFGMEDCSRMMKRLTIIKGDISEPYLGIKYPGKLDIDTLLHCAAITDHVGRYEDFYRTNVEGTKRAIELAQAAGAAMLHVSTCSVSGTYYIDSPAQKGEFDESCLYVGQNYADNVYVKSKFQAEEAVLEALDKGLNARIFRVGLLTGTVGGQFQMKPEKNAFANRIRALCEAGCVPIGMLGARVEMTPVEACAEAIVKLAKTESKHPVFHVYNDNRMTLGNVVALLEQCGYVIEVLSDSEFMRRMTLLSRKGEISALTGLVDDLNSKETANITITCKATRELLERTGFAWPEINADYMARFISSINSRQSKEI